MSMLVPRSTLIVHCLSAAACRLPPAASACVAPCATLCFYLCLCAAAYRRDTGKGDEFEENIAMHLWESLSWDKFISKLSEKYIKSVDNNFNNLVLSPPSDIMAPDADA